VITTFFALWPDLALRDDVHALAQRVAATHGGRATRRDRQHLTLIYIGATSDALLSQLLDVAAAVRHEPFEWNLQCLDRWKHNRIAWVGTDEVPEALMRLQGELRERVAALGVKVEKRAYCPHMTLVRDLRGAGPSRETLFPMRWRVEAFSLVKSDLNPARYTVLREWPLGRAERPDR
jgi:RNA 2',3'-cyclic 3'-phosphodiesterase